MGILKIEPSKSAISMETPPYQNRIISTVNSHHNMTLIVIYFTRAFHSFHNHFHKTISSNDSDSTSFKCYFLLHVFDQQHQKQLARKKVLWLIIFYAVFWDLFWYWLVLISSNQTLRQCSKKICCHFQYQLFQ
jgi:hypothetical protein